MSADLKKRLALLAVIVGVLLGIYLLWPSEAKKVERTVRGAAEAFEEENLIGLAGYVARDYADSRGRGYEEVLGFSKGLFDQYDGIAVAFIKLDVDLQGSRATVSTTVHVEGTDKKGAKASFLGDRDTLDVRFQLRKGRDGWRIAGVDEGGE